MMMMIPVYRISLTASFSGGSAAVVNYFAKKPLSCSAQFYVLLCDGSRSAEREEPSNFSFHLPMVEN
uniref:Putative secreted protein n=1 Tax=Anopheles darlingi TaxID=43151 RepID=A0A2M4DRH9_ANODA